MAATNDDVPASILEIELPAILLNESLFIELNGNLTQLLDTTSNLSQIIWNRSENGYGSGNTSTLDMDAEQRAAVEFWLLVKMIAMAVVLGLMILVTIIGKYLIKIKSEFKLPNKRKFRWGRGIKLFPNLCPRDEAGKSFHIATKN
ncbi:hypothetical protein M5D96_011260 [Drosophila gunungcola]|uniref:Uncharacterized protein n=1 Tax=Drosophila gunungcola TaxID=103775 RepID=A0A9P9YF36_9MUSC|nr:hypothetical protein M5D96_011260 [Drosophila gunungcola]